MNSNVIIFSALVAIVTFSAIIAKKAKMRIVATFFVFFLLVTSVVFSIDSAARRVITTSVQNSTYTKDFGDGVRSLRIALTSTKLILIICGAGLFLISLNTKLEKDRTGSGGISAMEPRVAPKNGCQRPKDKKFFTKKA